MRTDHHPGLPTLAAGLAKRRPRPRWQVACAALATAAAMAGCGGGGYIDSAGNFNIGVTVTGQVVAQHPVAPGGSLGVAIRAGQSVQFDAGEPAYWTLYVGGSSIRDGVRVSYAGAEMAATKLSASTVALDTYAAYLLQAPIAVTLVATSTYDAAQVATINLLITN